MTLPQPTSGNRHHDAHRALRLMALKAAIFILVPLFAAGLAALLILK